MLALGEHPPKLGAADLLEKHLQLGEQPVPVGLADGRRPRIRLAEAAVGPAEEHLAADHAHERPVAQDVFRRLGLVPADDGDAAGHELAEVVPGGAQHP